MKNYIFLYCSDRYPRIYDDAISYVGSRIQLFAVLVHREMPLVPFVYILLHADDISVYNSIYTIYTI